MASKSYTTTNGGWFEVEERSDGTYYVGSREEVLGGLAGSRANKIGDADTLNEAYAMIEHTAGGKIKL